MPSQGLSKVLLCFVQRSIGREDQFVEEYETGADKFSPRQKGQKEKKMKFDNLGMLLLAIFLILYGVAAFVSFGALSIIIPILAIIAGVLLLMHR